MSDILVAVRDVFLYKQRERQKMQARIEKWAHRPMGTKNNLRTLTENAIESLDKTEINLQGKINEE